MKPREGLATAFVAAYPAQASRVLADNDAGVCAAVLDRSPAAAVAATLRHLPPDQAAAILLRTPAGRTGEVLAELPLTAATLMLRAIGVEDRKRLIDAAPEAVAPSLRTALEHSEGTAGSLMEADALALPLDFRVGEARRHLRRRSRPTGNYLYVVDAERRLVGALSLGGLLLAAPSMELSSLMSPSVVRIPADAGVERILEHPGWRELHALPVVDGGGVLVGILRRETVERLREAHADRSAPNTNVTLALAEMAWTVMLSTVNEVAGATRRESPDDD